VSSSYLGFKVFDGDRAASLIDDLVQLARNTTGSAADRARMPT
jgi:hypothetical protein